MAVVTRRANARRSTARAPPAGTRVASAQAMTSDPRRRSSALSNPWAVMGSSLFSELEQTSSARSGEVWAGDSAAGFPSTISASTPARASCQAASQPASPPPTIVTAGTIRVQA